MPDPTESVPTAERTDAVLIVQACDVTISEWDEITAAVCGAPIPLSIAYHVSLHAAVDYVAERVMEAFDGA